MKIGFFQFAPRFGERDENLRKVAAAVQNASLNLLVLPELFSTGYLFTSKEDLAGLAEPIPGPTTLFLHEHAKRRHMFIVCGIAERQDDRFFNSAVLLGPDGVRAVYRKAHLFMEEKLLFTPGDSPFRVHDIGQAKVGMLICFDYWFPEAARKLGLGGAQIICHPSNLVLPEYGQEVSRIRAMENRLFWILTNRSGSDVRGGRELSFTGESRIFSPRGDILCKAGPDEESLQIVEIDPSAALDKHVTPMNDLYEDRRTDLYTR
jgi:predicted amidohydrolase